jgi:hypothetical protein
MVLPVWTMPSSRIVVEGLVSITAGPFLPSDGEMEAETAPSVLALRSPRSEPGERGEVAR